MSPNWYLADGPDGKDGKIISQAEAAKLSPAQKHGRLYTLSAALREGLLTADTSSAPTIQELPAQAFYKPPQKDAEGHPIGQPKPLHQVLFGNKLRQKVQAAKPKKS